MTAGAGAGIKEVAGADGVIVGAADPDEAEGEVGMTGEPFVGAEAVGVAVGATGDGKGAGAAQAPDRAVSTSDTTKRAKP